MSPIPPLPDGGGAPRPPGLLLSPKVGVIGMVFAFAVVVAAFVAVGLWSSGGGADAPTGDAGDVDLQHVGEGDLAGLLPEEASRELQEELFAFARDAARGVIADDAPATDLEWTRFLLEASLRNRLARLPARVFPRIENIPNAREDPASVRGSLAAIWGRVDSYEEVDVEHPSGLRIGWRVRITDAAGAPWIVTTLHEPREEVTEGRWVKAYGVFTKLWPDEDGGPMLHVRLTRSLVPSYAPVTHRQPRLEWLEQVRDGKPEESEGFEAEPFYGMLNFVRQLGPEGYIELRDTENLPVADLTGTQGSTPLWQNPDRWRFQLVRLRLAPVHDHFAMDRYIQENPGNIDALYRGMLVDDQVHPVQFFSPFPQDAFDFGNARMVEVEGFFFKRRHVTGTNGKSYWLPVIIGTSVIATDAGPYETGTSLNLVLGLLALGSVVMLGLLIMSWRKGKRREDEVRRRSEERRMKRGWADQAP